MRGATGAGKWGLVGLRGLCHGSVMPLRILLARDVEVLRERAREQMRSARTIQEHCAEQRVRLARQAAELVALGATWRRPPRRSW